jgi:hypothetical protein
MHVVSGAFAVAPAAVVSAHGLTLLKIFTEIIWQVCCVPVDFCSTFE